MTGIVTSAVRLHRPDFGTENLERLIFVASSALAICIVQQNNCLRPYTWQLSWLIEDK
jgi:hypothetical protein